MSNNNLIATAIVIPPPPPQTQPINTGYNQSNNNVTNQFKSPELLTYIQYNIKAGVDLDWCNRTILNWSKSAPFVINKYPWILDYLLNDLQTNLNKTSALSLRNLSQDSDFTQNLALHPRSRKILYQVLNQFEKTDIFDNRESNLKFKNLDNELLSYTIDIVESISSYFAPAQKNDEIILILIKIFLKNSDRSLLISIMRSFARFLVRSQISEDDCSANLNNPLIFDKITSFLLTNDYDLILTSLDLLYQYCLPGNDRISNLFKNSFTRAEILKNSLIELLTFQLNISNNPNDFKNLQTLRLIKRTRPPIPKVASKLSQDQLKIISQLEEPFRATAWMRCCYKSVKESEVTQISLWKSYESQFDPSKQLPTTPKKKLLPAVDFIKNVSQAFIKSSAMVIDLPNGSRKFIIKGIEPRINPVDLRTGETEAYQEQTISNEFNSTYVNSKSIQESQTPYNPPTQLNDVNKSSGLLLTSLTNHPLGKELFKPNEEEIFKKIEAVPVLFDELVDALKYLQEF
ncbi:hypothetical protein WICMUC_004661 [Wickerhamomyces mucosus]|uniref:RFX-type winged-helix domain-containing protein n=1 Tax=Wickerhamomyces mucosus TaxID=1378264 RepID=A0A9P8PH83_9ASCO|nr:hypothetical protein WICMUC_004661 [Wickerhamomyces mucosus]